MLWFCFGFLLCILLFLNCMYPALIRFKVEPEVNSFARIVTEQQGIHRNSLGLGSLSALYRCLWIVCVPHFLHPNSCCMWQWDHLVGFPLGEKMMTTIMAQLTMGDVDIKTAEKKKTKQQQQRQTRRTTRGNITNNLMAETTTINPIIMAHILCVKRAIQPPLCFSLSTIYFIAAAELK